MDRGPPFRGFCARILLLALAAIVSAQGRGDQPNQPRALPKLVKIKNDLF
jgi:hypothetical protein